MIRAISIIFILIHLIPNTFTMEDQEDEQARTIQKIRLPSREAIQDICKQYALGDFDEHTGFSAKLAGKRANYIKLIIKSFKILENYIITKNAPLLRDPTLITREPEITQKIPIEQMTLRRKLLLVIDTLTQIN
jgi:hypothetical protein